MSVRQDAAETGLAIERAGYRPCAAFGPYVAMSAHAIATSLSFEKAL